MKRFQPAGEPCRTVIAGMADLPLLPDIAFDEFDADYECNDSSEVSRANPNPPISMKQTEFSLKQFGNRMGQPNFSGFSKWMNVWVAGFLEKMHWFIIPGQNRFKQLQAGPPSAKCKLVWKPNTNLPDTLVALTSTSK